MKYRSDIDGLRALAVVPIILYHAGFTAAGGGYVGVDVFFVISGYLITTLIADELDRGEFSLWRFYERRARRILPALLLVILTCLPFSWFWLMAPDLKTFTSSVLAVVTFTSNFFFWSNTGYFQTMADLQPLLHTWSLAVEEQYYIFFPLLMMLIWRRQAVAILATLLIASLIFAEQSLEVDPRGVFFLLPARAWELLIGALAACYLRKTGQPPFGRAASEALAATGLALIAFAILTYDESTRFPGIGALPPTLGTVMVILFTRNGGLVHRGLSLKPLIWIGLRSYGTYLWHQPVFALFQHRFGSLAFEDYVWLLVLLSFVLSEIGYRIVEHPFRRLLPVRMLSWSVAAATAVAIGSALLISVQVGTRPDSIPSYRWALENADKELLRYVEGRDVRMDCGQDGPLGFQSCEFGALAADRTLVLWGDSLAGALLSGMDETAKKAGLRGVAFVANGCPPVLGMTNIHVENCFSDTHREILTRIEAIEGVTDVVITGNFSAAIAAQNVAIDGGPTSLGAVREKLSEAVARLHAAGVRVILLEQGPLFDEDVSNYLLQNSRHGRLAPLVVDRAAHVASLEQARTLADVVDLYIQTADLFCTDLACPSVDSGGQLVIFDRNHVTHEYSSRLARLVAQGAGF